MHLELTWCIPRGWTAATELHPYSSCFNTAFLNFLLVVVLCDQSFPTLSDPMDCSLPGSFVHEILQARILEWVAISSSGDLPDSSIEPTSPALAGRFFTTQPPGKLHSDYSYELFPNFSGRRWASMFATEKFNIQSFKWLHIYSKLGRHE